MAIQYPKRDGVDYKGSNESLMPPQIATYKGDVITLQENKFTKTGYNFGHWRTGDQAFANKANFRVNAPTIMTASWNIKTFTISFDSNGGTGSVANVVKNYGTAITLPSSASITKTGFKPNGWNTKADGTGTHYANGASYTGNANTTLYVDWSVNIYTITFDPNGATGGSMPMQYKTHGVSVVLNANKFTREHFKFDYWNNAASGGGGVSYQDKATYSTNSGIALYAIWKGDEVTVNFNANGGQNNEAGAKPSIKIRYWDIFQINSEKLPYKPGHYLYHWNLQSDGKSSAFANNADYRCQFTSSSVTLYAIWKPNTYTVTFNNNGGSGTVTNISGTYGSTITLPTNTCTKTGYTTVAGWATSPTATSTIKTLTITGNITLYAIYTINSYTITLMRNTSNSDTESMTRVKKYGENITIGNSWFVSGYLPAGWATSPSGAVAYAEGATFTGNANTVLYAKWTGVPYAVKFDGNGATSGSIANINVRYGTTFNLTANGFVKTGHTFIGWATSASGSKVYNNQQSVSNLTTVNNGIVTLYAKWTANSYSIAFNANGGSGTMSNLSMTYGTAKNLTANAFSKSGYSFLGWATSASGGVTYSNGQSVNNLATSGTITLYAVWGPLQYTISFNGNGSDGGSTASQTKYYNTDLKLNANGFTKTGHTFSCWSYTYGGSTTTISNQGTLKINASLILYAQWSANTITLAFSANGGSGSMATISGPYGTSKKLPANTFTRSGYKFAGWGWPGSESIYPGGIAHKDQDTVTLLVTGTLHAIWTSNDYTIAFNGNGATGGSTAFMSMKYGTAKNLTANGFTKTGYTFAGWATTSTGGVVYSNGQSVSNLATSGTVTLYAKWTANSYAIAFNGNGATGGSTASLSMTYNVAKNLTANGFTRTGYTFAGWATSSGGNVVYSNGQSVSNLATSGTVTLYAKWNANSYAIAFNGNGATGGSTASMSMTYGTAKNLTANGFTRTGYTFAGWATSSGGNAVYSNGQSVSNLATSGTVTLYAKWNVDTISSAAVNDIAYTNLVNGGSWTHCWQNFKVESSSALAHCNMNNDKLFNRDCTGATFATRTETEYSEKNKNSYSVTKVLGWGGTRLNYINFKNNHLVSYIKFWPSYSHINVGCGAALGGYGIGIRYWNSDTNNGSVSMTCSYGGTTRYVIASGKYFRFEMDINNNGSIITKTVDVTTTMSNTKGSIGAWNVVAFIADFRSQLVGLSKTAYTTQIRVKESTSASFSPVHSSFLCAIHFYVDH